jgi:hypothetical protein
MEAEKMVSIYKVCSTIENEHETKQDFYYKAKSDYDIFIIGVPDGTLW